MEIVLIYDFVTRVVSGSSNRGYDHQHAMLPGFSTSLPHTMFVL